MHTCLLATLSQWQSFISNVGLPGFFMIAVLVTMIYVLRWAAPHVRAALAAHLRLVNTLTDATERQADLNRRQTQSCEDTARILAELQVVHQPRSAASTLRTNRALRHAAAAIFESTVETRKAAVQRHTEAMQRELDIHDKETFS